MLIGVISDTHDRLPSFKNAITLFKQHNVKAILHAGDYVAPFAAKLIAPGAIDLPVHCIYGNNDGEKAGLKKTLPQIIDGPLSITLDNRKIVMHHFIDWLTPADMQGADVIITGHTHSIVNETKNGQLFLNPGECCGWLTNRCTVALLDLATLKAQILDVKPD
jgi:uncharacterized protein